MFLADQQQPRAQGDLRPRDAGFRPDDRPAGRQDLAVMGAGPEQVPAQRDGAPVQPHDDRRPASRRAEVADRDDRSLGETNRSSRCPP